MSEREKGAVLEALNQLDEKDKQFVLGYAAGRAADNNPSDGSTKEEEKEE